MIKTKNIKILFAVVLGVFAITSVAKADDITILEVKAVPNSGTVSVGQNLVVELHHPDHMSDITLGGSCTVNGKAVSPLENLGEGDYKLTYTVAEGDMDEQAGQVPFNCTLTNSAGLTDTLTAFTDNNTVAINGHTDTNNGTTTDDDNHATTTDDHSTTDGTINGDVHGGINTDNGTLAVNSIEQVRSTATADGTFENGWKWVFHVTVPTNETSLQLKFSNWTQNGTGNTIAAANNMRISSDQSSTAGGVQVTGADTYTLPLNITGDTNYSLAGRQVNIIVEMAVPSGSANGAYSATYHVRSSE